MGLHSVFGYKNSFHVEELLAARENLFFFSIGPSDAGAIALSDSHHPVHPTGRWDRNGARLVVVHVGKGRRRAPLARRFHFCVRARAASKLSAAASAASSTPPPPQSQKSHEPGKYVRADKSSNNFPYARRRFRLVRGGKPVAARAPQRLTRKAALEDAAALAAAESFDAALALTQK